MAFHHRMLHEGGFRVELDTRGATHFSTPKGRSIPESPRAPRLSGDPIAGLIHRHLDEGLEIDAFTGLPGWEGGSVDFNEAIQYLRARSGSDEGCRH